jgi:hypothetical protein
VIINGYHVGWVSYNVSFLGSSLAPFYLMQAFRFYFPYLRACREGVDGEECVSGKFRIRVE